MQSLRGGYDGLGFGVSLFFILAGLLLGYLAGLNKGVGESLDERNALERRVMMDSVIIDGQLRDMTDYQTEIKRINQLYLETREKLWECLPTN